MGGFAVTCRWRFSAKALRAAATVAIVVFCALACWYPVRAQEAEPSPPGETATPGDQPASMTSIPADRQEPREVVPPASPRQPMASPVQGSPRRERVLAALQSEDFAYAPENLIDPFLSFIVTQTENLSALTAAENDEEPPKLQMPLTPLQKMALGQIERGFKGVLWGEMGIRAMVEDDAGKGYIVAVGTPIGSHNGVVSDILSDRMVIRQEVWDPGQKKLLPRTVEIKLQKSAQR